VEDRDRFQEFPLGILNPRFATLGIDFTPQKSGDGLRAGRLGANQCLALYRRSTPDRLVVAPIDLRIADAHIAEEIYSGRFALAAAWSTPMARALFRWRDAMSLPAQPAWFWLAQTYARGRS
jgi:hypothetical protein